MRYSFTALALALATASQVTAQPSKHAARHGHAAFHAKKDAGLPEAEKRDTTNWDAALSGVDWDAALANVDWSAVSITYSSGQTFGESTAAAVAAVETTVTTTPVAQVAAAKVTSPAAAPATTSAPATTLATSTSSAAKASSSAESIGDSILGAVSNILTSTEEAAIKALGMISAGTNAVSSSESVWIGTTGPYTMEVNNAADEGIYLVGWGPSGSWVNVNTPLITLYLAAGASTTLSFSNGASGALSAIYSDTQLVDGQVSNTWIEFTMGEYGVVDISKEVNMGGKSAAVVGPECTTNMTTCVFECADSSVTSCETGYVLTNCATGSQSGAQFGTFDGADSGGCGGLGSAAHMVATFS